ncbi:MAG: hypothetical protein PWP12_143 [Bacillota bacterium]|nr:hypothetical protein [Bacillota bacterium]MDK2959959.1 hypothetical protein [Bacillota bacterium]
MPRKVNPWVALGKLSEKVHRKMAPLKAFLTGQRLLAAGIAVFLLLLLAGVLPMTQRAWAVSVDGEIIGWTADKEATAAYVQEILGQDGAASEAAGRISYTPVPRNRIEITPPEAMKEKLACALLGLTEAWAITVDGEACVAVASEEEAQAVVDGLKAAFPPEEGTMVKEISFKEEVAFAPELVKEDQVHSVQAAIEYLLRGTDEMRIYEVKQGDSLWSIARAHDLRVADLEKANPGVSERLQIGQKLNLIVPKPFVTVVSREEKTVTENVPFPVETVKDSSLYTYERKVRTPGQPGSKKVTYSIVRENGQVVAREVLDSVVEKEPVTQVVAVGTRQPAIVGTGRYIWPISREGVITSRYGTRGREFHGGVDIAAPTGTPVRAADSGRVIFAGWKGGYGKCVILEHGNGSATLYGHLSQIMVKEGQKVTQGQTIGLVGSTGKSTGPHLHFEIMQGGVRKDPLKYFNHK